MADRCPDCGSDDIDRNPPYAECISCGWEGRDTDLTDTTTDRKTP